MTPVVSGQTWHALAFAEQAHSMAVGLSQCSSEHDDSVCRNAFSQPKQMSTQPFSGTSRQSLPCSPKPSVNNLG